MQKHHSNPQNRTRRLIINKTIYPSRSQVANKVFSEITDLRKLLIVPIDFAKKEYTVQFCLGTGDFLLKRPLTI